VADIYTTVVHRDTTITVPRSREDAARDAVLESAPTLAKACRASLRLARTAKDSLTIWREPVMDPVTQALLYCDTWVSYAEAP
jgi:hypothetical protein